MIKYEELKDMFERQYKLNEHFNGKNWEEKLKEEDIKIAVLTEFAEFLEEVPKWKWWKPYKLDQIEQRKQYEELIDILHFAMTLLMKRWPREIIYDSLKNSNSFYIRREYLFFKNEDKIDIVDFVYRFLTTPVPINYLLMIEALVDYAQLDETKLYSVYLQKNEKNHKRIEAGYMEGNEEIKKQEKYVEV